MKRYILIDLKTKKTFDYSLTEFKIAFITIFLIGFFTAIFLVL